jgi:hypothetical protein
MENWLFKKSLVVEGNTIVITVVILFKNIGIKKLLVSVRRLSSSGIFYSNKSDFLSSSHKALCYCIIVQLS